MTSSDLDVNNERMSIYFVQIPFYLITQRRVRRLLYKDGRVLEVPRRASVMLYYIWTQPTSFASRTIVCGV